MQNSLSSSVKSYTSYILKKLLKNFWPKELKLSLLGHYLGIAEKHHKDKQLIMTITINLPIINLSNNVAR